MGIVVAGTYVRFTDVRVSNDLLGSSIGAVIHPIILNNTFGRPDGFAWGVR